MAAIRTLALVLAMLRPHLRLRRHNDAIVMLGVLQIAFGGDHVARGESVAGERHVFVGDMSRGSADLHVGTIRLVVTRQWILRLAVPAPAGTVLLYLPLVLSFTL